MTLDHVIDADSPVLSDSTLLKDLIDVDYREVSLRLMSDAEIYRLELDRIFARAWAIVAHEDEIASPGDYVVRYIGQDEVIVSRGKDGEIFAVLNVCTHRASKLCRFECGNTARFECAYHGWMFRPDGAFLGSPIARQRMHGELRTKDELSLTTARVETYAGMVFATFDQEAPPLREWLGPMTWYFDLMFDKTPEGMTSIGAPQRFTLRANWKSAAEQFGGDIFHSLTLHRSMQELGLLSTDGPVQEPGLRGVSICHNGHFAFCFDFEEALYINALKGRNLQQMTALERLKAAPPPSLTADMVDRMVGKFSEDQLRVLATFPPQVGSFFPNIAAVSMAFPMSDGSMSGFCTWRAWVPRGPESFEMFHWTVVERNAPQAMRDAIRMTTANIFGISGWVEADDTDTWPTQTKNSVGTMGRRQKLRYQAIAGPGAPPGWPGPGQTYSGFAKDDAQWNFWLQYLKFMNGRPW